MLSLLAQLPAKIKTEFEEKVGGPALGIAGAPVEPQVLAGLIIKGLLSIVGVVFFILAIYGGFIWMKARGNEKEVERAKDILTNAMIGIVLIFAAYALTSFILAVAGQQ